MPEDDGRNGSAVADEPKRFQVRYKDGGGEQVSGESVEAVTEECLKKWGDREIVSCEEIKSKEP